jgi:glycosyltransferase involved in cell wall biosynthesis
MTSVMSDVPILVLAPNAWEGPWMNRQQIFSRVGRHRRVLYSNGIWRSHDLGRARWNASPLAGATYSKDNVLVDSSPRWLIRQQRWQPGDKLAIWAAARRWRTLLRADQSGLVAYVFHPSFAAYVRPLRPEYLVYHAYDLFDRFRGWSSEAAQAQVDLIRNANLVLASSQVTADALASAGGRDVTVLPNGADVDAFILAATEKREPEEMCRIPHPRVGYAGNLNRKVDLNLIGALAERRPDWHFVLVGQVRDDEPDTASAIRQLRNRPNVHFIGAQGHRDIPHFVAAMDVNLICYDMRDDLWVQGCYPLKLHEYLATGAPIVSADLPAVRPFQHVVAIARSEDQWHDAIATALRGEGSGSLDSRRSVARANGWDARIQSLNRLLSGLMAARSDPRHEGNIHVPLPAGKA